MRRDSCIWVVLWLLLLLPMAASARADEATADREAEALRVLAKAFPKGSPSDQIAAIREADGVNTATVSKEIRKQALHSKNETVQIEALKALGRMDNPESVKALNNAYTAHESVRKDEKFFVTLLTEIGRLGDPSSVKILSDKPFKYATEKTTKARIYGLGNIRTIEAIEALIRGLALANSNARGVFTNPDLETISDFRTALNVLTGTDQGEDKALWQNWWRSNAKTFAVDAELPVIPRKLEARWEAFWGVPYPVEQPAHGFTTFEWVLDPSPEQVKAAVADLEAARKSKGSSKKLAAIYANMLVVDPKVVKAIRKVAKKSGRSVIEAAIDALGWMPHKSALKELQDIYRRHRDLYKFENYFVRMLKSIGRHSDESALKLLLDKPFTGLTLASGRARILSVARIRTKKALTDLFKMMQKAGGGGNRALQAGPGTQPFMGAFRLALVVLTGIDKGMSKLAWLNWWRANKRTFKMEPKRPRLTESQREAWEEYWEEPYGDE